MRECSAYRVTLDDPKFYDACNEIFRRTRAEISLEREYRAQLRQARQRSHPRQSSTRTGALNRRAGSSVTCEGLNLSSMGEVISNKTLQSVKRETGFDERRDLLQRQAEEISAKYGVHRCG